MEERQGTTFNALYSINVNQNTEKKNGLTYLSWAWAWAEFKKVYPLATYEIKHWDGKPFLFEEGVGFMCETSVTVGDLTHSMWLPVMDSNNRAMMKEAYEVQTKYKKITVEKATMFDINKTIMRCLTKNLAMFGLGLYIYAGEDLPEGEEEPKQTQKVKPQAQKVAKNVNQEQAPYEKMNNDDVQEKNSYLTKISAYVKQLKESGDQVKMTDYNSIVRKHLTMNEVSKVTDLNISHLQKICFELKL